MIIDAVTETGARYRIDFDRQLWTKIDRHGYRNESERIWRLEVGTELVWPWQAEDGVWQKADRPVIGKHLFISAKDVWYVSTPITEIREVEDWFEGRETDG